MKKTTLCYIFCGDEILMIHRIKKKNDENEGKYIGLGGHFLENEDAKQCVLREVLEESGIDLLNPVYNGIVTFHSDLYPSEEMHLFTAFLEEKPPLPPCDEGVLCFVKKEQLLSLKMWEGDLIFLSLLFEKAPFFHLTLRYKGERLEEALLDGRPTELLDLLDDDGNKSGKFKERSLIHRDGDLHKTVHVWIYRKKDGRTHLLLQKRAARKDAYPGLYDISCAGHLGRGEEPSDGAMRELAEELGICPPEDSLCPIGHFDRFTKESFYGQPFLDNERAILFLLDGAPFFSDHPSVWNDEVEGALWVDLEELLKDHTLGGDSCIVKEELQLVADALK